MSDLRLSLSEPRVAHGDRTVFSAQTARPDRDRPATFDIHHSPVCTHRSPEPIARGLCRQPQQESAPIQGGRQCHFPKQIRATSDRLTTRSYARPNWSRFALHAL